MDNNQKLDKLVSFLKQKLSEDLSDDAKNSLRETLNKIEELDKPEEIFCDLCKKSCNTEYGAEFAEIKASWGYPSNKDLQEHYCRLCENCYDQIAHIIQQNGGQIHISNIGPQIFNGI